MNPRNLALPLALLLALIAIGLPAAQTDSPLRIISLEPTVLFPNKEPLCQVARLVVGNRGSAPIAAEVQVTIPGAASLPVQAIKLAANEGTYDVLIPDISAAAEVRVEIRAGGRVVTSHTQAWQPQRKWKIFIVKSSHEDLGYEGFIHHKQHEIANYIELARDVSQPKVVDASGMLKSAGYHYTMETILFQRNYIEERGEQAWRDLIERQVKTGRMSLMGAPSGVHSHWMDYEELARMTYPARRETRDRFGVDVKTFMIVDNPSLSWSGAQALANAGFKYVARWGQGWRAGGNNNYETTGLPALFWWKAPDGESRVLFGWRSRYAGFFWYGQTGGGHVGDLGNLPSQAVNTYFQNIESGAELGPYPYDAVVMPTYVDHDIPRFDDRLHSQWVKKYAFPEIRISSPEPFFKYIEGKYGPMLPILSGDLNNFSADYSTIDPESQGWKRRAARLLPLAEGLGALATDADPGYFLSPSGIDRIYTRMFDYDEHSWPTLPPATDPQLFNANWVKKHEARRLFDATEKAFGKTAAAFARNIATGDGESFAVFNPLAHTRTDLVRMGADYSAVTDMQTGRQIPCQNIGDGNVVFLANDVPAYGYKLYRVERTIARAASTSNLAAGEDSLSNQYYDIDFDPKTGAIKSIWDKELDRELLSQAGPYQGNQMVYVRAKTGVSKALEQHLPKNVKRKDRQAGPVAASYTVWIDDAGNTGALIRQAVTIYADIKRIDVVNHLERASALFVDYRDRYRNNIFYAFPFDVKQGQFRVEYPGGVVRPYKDQLRWGSHDYLQANRWVDVSNDDFGVTIAPVEASNFHFGEIRYNQFSIDYEPKSSWLFSYAWSDRMSGLLTLNGDDCSATFGYSITSHRGDWDAGDTTRFGWSVASPLEAIELPSRQHGKWKASASSFIALNQPNVQLTVLKTGAQPAGGWIARLVETEGRSTDVVLDAGRLGIDAASECDLVENDMKPAVVNGGKVSVKLRPFGFQTLRLLRGTAPASVVHVVAAPLSDSQVRLSWQRASTAGFAYNIYRSDDPDAPATDYTLVGRTMSDSFTDAGLHPRTSYYYRVAAVGGSNRQGPISTKIAAVTSDQNQTPPAPIEELGVVRKSGTSVFVYWRKNTEPDVARQFLFRSESPNFDPHKISPMASLLPSKYFLQVHPDNDVRPGKTYYYKVLTEDWAGNRQMHSSEASVTTPKS
ncbi:MAG: glycoside hydrolase family 38 C-terminal domain-containing protein [Opitutaceae bacterium]|nr:glycoside hydrolase family 38 C-terminal domain-containing protein [Opitutaceae bacterium]